MPGHSIRDPTWFLIVGGHLASPFKGSRGHSPGPKKVTNSQNCQDVSKNRGKTTKMDGLLEDSTNGWLVVCCQISLFSPRHDCYYLEPSAELPEEAPVSAAYEVRRSVRGPKGRWFEVTLLSSTRWAPEPIVITNPYKWPSKSHPWDERYIYRSMILHEWLIFMVYHFFLEKYIPYHPWDWYIYLHL